MKKIGIFPASGGLGGSTYRHLLQAVANDNVILISRHPDKIPQEYTSAGVVTRQASYESTPAQLEDAFSGVEVLFLISYPSHVHEYRVKVQLPAIDAARRAGVKHIFYSSLGFASDPETLTKSSSLAVVMQAHLDTEKYLESIAQSDPSFTYTSVREGLYSESFPIYTAFFNPHTPPEHGEIQIPHDGSGPGIAWVKRDELGEATAALLARFSGVGSDFPRDYVNGKVLLTGQRVWTLAETVHELGKVSGKPVTIRQITTDEYAALPQVLNRFGSTEKALTWATAWEAIRSGETAVVSPELEEILGRQPEAFDVTLKAQFSC